MTRHLPATATYAIAVLAFALSYSNLAELAARAGYGTVMAHVWPLVVDGLAVVATAAVMRLHASRIYAWSLLAAATAVSIVAGAAVHLLPAGPLPSWAGAAVAVVPPMCLLVAPHLAVQLRRDAVVMVVDAPAADEARHDARADDEPRVTSIDQPRRTTTHDMPEQGDTPDVALFDLNRDAPTRKTRRTAITVEQRAKVLRLAATTSLSGRDIGDAAGTSEPTVRRIIRDAGGRDALRADATPALAAVGG